MGGGIAQSLAVSDPGRVLSLTLIATTAALERADPSPLPPPEPRVAATFSQEAPAVDWSDEAAVVEANLDALRPYAGSLGLDEDHLREVSRTVVRRTRDMAASITNHWAVAGDDDGPVRTMSEIAVPTLVLHGSDDPLFPYPHGEALAEEIPGARLLPLPGMGHEVPPPALWDLVVPAILEHTGA
jgi:pimeloyl-ACP methyl ester carboxylesterase